MNSEVLRIERLGLRFGFSLAFFALANLFVAVRPFGGFQLFTCL